VQLSVPRCWQWWTEGDFHFASHSETSSAQNGDLRHRVVLELAHVDRLDGDRLAYLLRALVSMASLFSMRMVVTYDVDAAVCLCEAVFANWTVPTRKKDRNLRTSGWTKRKKKR